MEKSRFLIFCATMLIFSNFYFFTALDDSSYSAAIQSLNDSQKVIDNMNANNFSTIYVRDLLIEQKKMLQIVDYTHIILNDNSEPLKRAEASQALALIDWKNLSYGNVINFYDKIKQREEQAFIISDSLSALNIKFENEKNKGFDVSSSEQLLNQAKESFSAERYDEALEFIGDARFNFENMKAENARMSIFKDSIFNILQKYWHYFVIGIFFFLLIFWLVYKKIKKYNLLKKITHLKAEQQVLMSLIIRTQNERYKENKISGIVYNIRTKKYQDRIDEIKEMLPVLDARLRGKKLEKKRVKIS